MRISPGRYFALFNSGRPATFGGSSIRTKKIPRMLTYRCAQSQLRGNSAVHDELDGGLHTPDTQPAT
jgi:hypothetical protein